MSPTDQELLAETPVSTVTLEICPHGCRYTKRDSSGRFLASGGQNVNPDRLLQWLADDLKVSAPSPRTGNRLRRVHLYCDPMTSNISGEYASLHEALRVAPLESDAGRACPRLMSNGEILAFPYHYGWALTAHGLSRIEAEYISRGEP